MTKSIFHTTCDTISRPSLLFHWFMLDPNVSILTSVTNCSLSWINFKFGNQGVQFLQIFSFLKTYLAILGSLHFHIGFRIISSISIRKSARILTGTVWNLWINFLRADTAIFSFLTHEHRISPHLFRCSLNFSSALFCNFQWISLLRILLHLFLSKSYFWCYDKWYILISTSKCLLIVYRNIIDFSVLILHPEIFLNILI